MKADVKITDIHRLIFRNTKEINFLVNQRREECAVIRQKKVKLTQTQISEGYLPYLVKYKSLVFQYENYVDEDGLYNLIHQHNAYAIEFALCFVEIRPYYFGSGYMFQRLMKKLNQVPVSEHQKERFLKVKANLAEYKSMRRKK